MFKQRFAYMDAATGDDATGSSGGAGAAATDAAASTDQTAATTTTTTAAATTAPAKTTVLTPTAPAIPEKYQVKKEDGTLDFEASAAKLAQGYGELSKRFGSGDAPPKSEADYQVTIPDAFKEAGWKPDEDQSFIDFRKEAHGKGMTQAQFDFVMGTYFKIAPQLAGELKALSADECAAELKKEWKSPEQYSAEIDKAKNALTGYAGQDADGLMNDYANDPRFVRMLARIGAEMGEDKSPNPSGLSSGVSVESLMNSEAYTNPKHADHERVSKQVMAHFESQAAKAQKSGAVPLF